MNLSRIKRFDPLIIVIASYTIALIYIVLKNSFFRGDDYLNFYLTIDQPFWKYIFLPIDVHFVPLHRAFSYFIFKLFPLNFPVALTILSFFHVVTLVILFQTLKLINQKSSRFLIFIYATHVYLFPLFIWWSSGLHRHPYIMFSVLCIYAFIRYRSDFSIKKHLITITISFILALGFYIKSIFIPFYLLGIELAYLKETSREQTIRNLRVIFVLGFISFLFFIASRLFIADQFNQMNIDIKFIAKFLCESYLILVKSLFTLPKYYNHSIWNITILTVCLIFFLWTIKRKPSVICLWLILFFLISFNFIIIAISSRTLLFGILIAGCYRYFFELLFVLVIFTSIILNKILSEHDAILLPKSRQLIIRSKYIKISIAFLYMILSLYHSQQIITADFSDYLHTKQYMAHLISGIEKLKNNSIQDLSFKNGRIPKYVVGFANSKIGSFQEFFRIFNIDVRFGEQKQNVYYVTEDGKVQPVTR